MVAHFSAGADGIPPAQGCLEGMPSLPVHGMFGRDALLAELRARVLRGEGAAITALQGLPGVGKTTLAVALVHDDAVRGHFGGGIYWAALGPSGDVEGALDRWGRAVGLDLGDAGDAVARARRVGPALERAAQRRPALLVVDDVWKWEHASPFRDIAFPGCVRVCTTRDETIAQRFAGREMGVAELSAAEAEAFLASRCPEAAKEDATGLRELARAVGGLPLALGLIAGTLVQSKGQARWVREAMKRLQEAAERLALEGVDRAGTVRAIVEMSVTVLPLEVQAAFDALGAFTAKPATFGPDELLEVWGVDEKEKRDGWLRVLMERGLLEGDGEDRLAIHPVLADVAWARLEKSGDVRGRHAGVYLAVAESNPGDWRRIEVELEQIRRGWEWVSCLADDDSILAYYRALYIHFVQRGLLKEHLAWAEKGLSSARRLKRQQDEALVLNNIGGVHRRLGDQQRALEYYEKALPICHDAEDRIREAMVLNDIGLVYSRFEKQRALEYYEKALPIFCAIGHPKGEATTLNNIGRVYISVGDEARALEYYEKSLLLRRDAGDRQGEAVTLNNIGRVYSSLGDTPRALEYYEKSLPIRRESGDRAGEAVSLFNIARSHADQHNFDAAIPLMEQAVAIAEAIQYLKLPSYRDKLERLRARQRRQTVTATQPPVPPPPPAMPLPTLPPRLLAAHRSSKLALFVGSGLSRGLPGNLPAWPELPQRLLDACERYDRLDSATLALKRQQLALPLSLESMLAELGVLRTALARDYQAALNDIFRPGTAAPGTAHQAIAALDVHALLTTNYDPLFELLHETPPRQPYTWKEADRALVDLRAGRKVLLKVHGTAERHETVVMSDREYDAARADASYQAVLRYLLADHVFLFLGYGMNDPLDLDLALKSTAEALKSAAQRHYVLVRRSQDPDRDHADADRLEREYNVKVVPYDDHAQVPDIVGQIASAGTGGP